MKELLDRLIEMRDSGEEPEEKNIIVRIMSSLIVILITGLFGALILSLLAFCDAAAIVIAFGCVLWACVSVGSIAIAIIVVTIADKMNKQKE